MKPICWILALLPFLYGCTQTKERKAAQIAKSELLKVLYYPDSYQAVETKVDSAYTSVYTDREVLGSAHDLIELNADSKRKLLRRQYNLAKSLVASFSNSRNTYAQEQYRQAKEQMEDYARQLEALDEEERAKIQTLLDCVDAVVEHQFCGWYIYHRFRCSDGSGDQWIGDVVILVDENMEEVKWCHMLEEDDGGDYSLETLQKVIDEVLDRR